MCCLSPQEDCASIKTLRRWMQVLSSKEKAVPKNHLAIGQMDILNLNVPYHIAPTDLFATLCGDQPHSLLLESAEIDSKKNLKSLMLIDTAIRIVCRGHRVNFQAKTTNGENLLSAIVARFQTSSGVHFESINPQTLTLVYQQANHQQDEDSRLHQPSVFDALRMVQQACDHENLADEAIFIGGLFAYDLVAQFEPLPELEGNAGCPDYVFFVAETLMVIDHQNKQAHLQASLFGGLHVENHSEQLQQRLQSIHELCSTSELPALKQEVAATDLGVETSDADFCSTVTALKQFVQQGEVFQVVPSRRFILPCSNPLAAYVELKAANPSPYMFFMQDSDFTLFGASPESALKYTKSSNQVEIYPIAGTRPRGKNADGSINLDLDGRIELELRNDEKEKAEHMMLVDLARNDVARISEAGTRYVADLLKVDRYSHVMHLVSRVVGQLRSDFDALHAYQACMNMGTLTGAPKIRAMQLIRQFEHRKRGSYGGCWLSDRKRRFGYLYRDPFCLCRKCDSLCASWRWCCI